MASPLIFLVLYYIFISVNKREINIPFYRIIGFKEVNI